MRAFIGFIILLLLSSTAIAVGVDDRKLANPADEARAQELMKQIRCLVCQNQSIVDSDAGLAGDLRMIVRERIVAGDSDQQIFDYMTNRYGDWVLLKPPFDGATIVLWLSPLLLLMIGFYVIFRNQKQSATVQTVAPLSDEEKSQLAALLEQEEKS